MHDCDRRVVTRRRQWQRGTIGKDRDALWIELERRILNAGIASRMKSTLGTNRRGRTDEALLSPTTTSKVYTERNGMGSS